MDADNALWVRACHLQLCNDALLRSGVPDREGRRPWSTPVDLLHVRALRLFLPSGDSSPRVIVRLRAIEASFLFSVVHFELTGVCDPPGGPPDCSCTKALTQLMGERVFHLCV